MTLEQKIKYEYRRFYLDMVKTSRENIFAHSSEIEAKKEIMNELFLLTLKLDEQTQELLLLEGNLLRSAYCFMEELEDPDAKADIPGALNRWLEFLKSEERRGNEKKSDLACKGVV